MSKILISGGNGNFVKQLVKFNTNHELFTPSKHEMDITDIKNIDSFVYKVNPNIFIHAGAMTRPIVIHEKYPDKSIVTNIVGTSNVVLTCMKYNIKLIYISTDYVYPGVDGNYKETDSVLPFTKYGWSKLGGECAVQMYDNHLILRISMNNKPFPHKKALVDMKKSLIFDDTAAKITFKLLDESGIINVGGESKSVYDFVKGTNPNIEPIKLSEIDDVNMAKDCSINISKLKRIIDDTII
jgi:dTDP-4-dehydrorhamnose reductase